MGNAMYCLFGKYSSVDIPKLCLSPCQWLNAYFSELPISMVRIMQKKLDLPGGSGSQSIIWFGKLGVSLPVLRGSFQCGLEVYFLHLVVGGAST